MILYTLEVGFSWFILYLFYVFFLRNENSFTFNRGYLLIALIAGILLPFLQIESSSEYLPQFSALLNEISTVPQNTEISTSHLSISFFVYSLYLIGVIAGVLRLFKGLLKIRRLYRGAETEQKSDYTIVRTSEHHSPFSFGKHLFISNNTKINQREYDYILNHELTHIRQNHTVDVLWVEVLSIIFWFNPLIYLYKRALSDQHEYLADNSVLFEGNIKEYGQLLIEQSIPGLKIGLVNHLIYSQLKKRINMMTKKQSSRLSYLKYASGIASFLLVFFIVSCQKQGGINTSETSELDEKIYDKVDIMPLFSGCENEETNNRANCTSNKLMTFIGENLIYPEVAKENKTEGMVLVNFVINKEGKVQDIKILKNPGDGCGKETARIIELMNEKNLVWTPGQKDGKKVSVKFTLPVRFKLQ
jgi:TonB family protein